MKNILQHFLDNWQTYFTVFWSIIILLFLSDIFFKMYGDYQTKKAKKEAKEKAQKQIEEIQKLSL